MKENCDEEIIELFRSFNKCWICMSKGIVVTLKTNREFNNIGVLTERVKKEIQLWISFTTSSRASSSELWRKIKKLLFRSEFVRYLKPWLQKFWKKYLLRELRFQHQHFFFKKQNIKTQIIIRIKINIDIIEGKSEKNFHYTTLNAIIFIFKQKGKQKSKNCLKTRENWIFNTCKLWCVRRIISNCSAHFINIHIFWCFGILNLSL